MDLPMKRLKAMTQSQGTAASLYQGVVASATALSELLIQSTKLCRAPCQTRTPCLDPTGRAQLVCHTWDDLGYPLVVGNLHDAMIFGANSDPFLLRAEKNICVVTTYFEDL